MPAATTDGPVVDARGLYHIYREANLETVALRGAELSIAPGEWVAVMGPSGSGKSTLLNVLAGLLEPSGGQVMVAGRDITRQSEAERAELRRSHIGVVMQRDNLHPLLTVAENVALPLQMAGSARRAARDRVAELLQRVGLTQRARNRPHHLSGGEAQRAAIAVAVASRPSVLIADEPTGELDEDTAAEVLDLLGELRTVDGTAIVTVTHNQGVARCADRRLGMRDGVLRDEA
ncbi:MAG: ABC transporter ATP-binding protein [Actinomycetota bacterium]|nr:ABC transporter ATP-binding protein [Actinomycetota bacterium]